MDKDKKIIGFYKNYSYINEEKEIINVNNKSYLKYVIIIILLIFLLIRILYYFLVVKRVRKIRANELEDKFSYIPNSKENKEKALIEN